MLTESELRALRLRAQCLAPRFPREALVDVVRTVCGVNAQLPSAMMLSLRARVKDLTVGDVETSRVKDRAVVRTWCMRGTLHLLATDDLEWLLSAVAPAVTRGAWRWSWALILRSPAQRSVYVQKLASQPIICQPDRLLLWDDLTSFP